MFLFLTLVKDEVCFGDPFSINGFEVIFHRNDIVISVLLLKSALLSTTEESINRVSKLLK